MFVEHKWVEEAEEEVINKITQGEKKEGRRRWKTIVKTQHTDESAKQSQAQDRNGWVGL